MDAEKANDTAYRTAYRECMRRGRALDGTATYTARVPRINEHYLNLRAASWLQLAMSLSVGSAAPRRAAGSQRGKDCNERHTRPSESDHFNPPPSVQNDQCKEAGQPHSVACRSLRTGGSDLEPSSERKEDASMAKRQRRSERKVHDIMVQDVVSIEPAASLADAARAMEEANVGMLPVVQDGKVLGVITDRDIVVRAVARDADPASTAVGDCLSINAIVAHPEWNTEQAMQTMAQAQVGRLPVLDDEDQLVGVVTLSSLAFRAPEKNEALVAAQEVSRRSAKRSA